MHDAQHPQNKTIRDSRGRRLALETLLGRGSFGKVYRAEDQESGELLAAKLPLTEEDLPGEPPSPELQDMYIRLVREGAARLKKLPRGLTPRIFGVVDGGGAIPCLLQEYLEDSLLERLRSGMTFAELCGTLARACEALAPLHATGQTHGNLKPGNIFFVPGPNGEEVAKFTDPLTLPYLRNLSALEGRQPGISGWLPPEINREETKLPLPSTADTFTIAKLLYEAVLQPEVLTTGYSGHPGPFVGAIDKTATKRFKMALAQRLHEGNSNPHVRELLVRRATAFLTRAISAEIQPSPPYRFYSASEMANRLIELQELFHPGLAQLGLILPDSPRPDGRFREDDEIRFSLSFRCHGGIEDVDLVTCRTYVRDLVEDEKVKNAGIEVVATHDGNRFRFSFRIPHLKAGRYLVRVALGIKGSPGKPSHRDATIDVMPAEDATSDKRRQGEAAARSNGAPGAGKTPRSLHPRSLRQGSPREDDTRRDEIPVALREPSSGPRPSKGIAEVRTREKHQAVGHGTPDRRNEWKSSKDSPHPGRDLVWMADDSASDRDRAAREKTSLPGPRAPGSGDSSDGEPHSVVDRPRRAGPRPPAERVKPRSTGGHPTPSPERGRDIGDRYADLRNESKDMDEGPSASPEASRELDSKPAKPRSAPPSQTARPERMRAAKSDDTLEMPRGESLVARTVPRSRLEPTPVGHDAIRLKAERRWDDESGGESIRRAAVPRGTQGKGAQPKGTATGGGGEKGSTWRQGRNSGASREAEREGRRAEGGEPSDGGSGRREPDVGVSRKLARAATVFGMSGTKRKRPAAGASGVRLEKPPLQPGEGKPPAAGESPLSRQDHGKETTGGKHSVDLDARRSESEEKSDGRSPSALYYREARKTPAPGGDDAFLRRGALKPMSYAILVGTLSLIILTTVGLIVLLLIF